MRAIRFLLALIVLATACRAAGAGPPPGLALERLRSDLLGNLSATQVLTKWCGALRLASPAVIRAQRVHDAEKAPTRQVLSLLAVRPNENIRYRRVRLMCGNHLLSEADNWYRPSQLTPEMNKQLDETDIPFGKVVQPLNFHRQTLGAQITGDRQSPLRVRALLLTNSDIPFSFVVENYNRDLTAGAPP